MRRGDPDPAAAAASGGPFVLPERGVILETAIRSLLDQALVRTAGNKSRTATLLGVHRDQVRYWVRKFGLERWVRRKAKPPQGGATATVAAPAKAEATR